MMRKNWIQLRHRRGERWYRKTFQLNLDHDFIGTGYRVTLVEFVWRKGQWCFKLPKLSFTILTQREIQSLLEIVKELNSKRTEDIF